MIIIRRLPPIAGLILIVIGLALIVLRLWTPSVLDDLAPQGRGGIFFGLAIGLVLIGAGVMLANDSGDRGRGEQCRDVRLTI